VRENHVQACYTKDGDNVWEDSCVEFFIAFEDDISYYNIECNCIGTLLVSTGIDRNRQPVPMNLLKKIKRWSNIGAEPVNKKKSEGIEWELALIAPKEIFCLHRLEHFSGLRAKGNFYKCGDNLEIPHFLSWSPIQSDTPNFHLPSFFGEFFFNY
jgi:hypothetical protein